MLYQQPALSTSGNAAAVLAQIPLTRMELLQVYRHVNKSKIKSPVSSLPATTAQIYTELFVRYP